MANRRIARYNGMTWDMGDAPAQAFLDEALVPHYPDLRGATFATSIDLAREEEVFDFSKRAGQKGLTEG
mgnify:CR=1 FL=1|tara:strand:+ start:1643 stop:1849 length:207 start_codon:yes stop_codon:yes gene_type:complete